MAADGTMATPEDDASSSDFESLEDHGGSSSCGIQRRARVTVKYNRKELQKRLDVEKWIDECLDQLYKGKEDDMPDEVNIDDLLDLPNDEERVIKLKELLHKCSSDTEAFIKELVGSKLEGLHKQDELQSETIEHPAVSHSHYHHEPYHFNSPHHHQQQQQHPRSHNQTL